MKREIFSFLFFAIAFAACQTAEQPVATEEDAAMETVTPVTLTSVSIGPLQDVVELNATSSFLLKTTVKSTANGYLKEVNAQLGKYVSRGQDLFVVKTKEAENLGNTVNQLDTSFHFSGTIHIKSPGSGYITQLAVTAGDYVQDGDPLLTITDAGSFVFLLNLPYELKQFLPNNNTVEVELPGGQKLSGTLSSSMPAVDPVSQTQQYVIHVNTNQQIPENLIAKVKLVKSSKSNAVSVPKASVLTDETQSEFWLMKMINDSTAVKMAVTKGLETNDMVEILFPSLTAADKILLTGNYGLSDTAKVIIEK